MITSGRPSSAPVLQAFSISMANDISNLELHSRKRNGSGAVESALPAPIAVTYAEVKTGGTRAAGGNLTITVMMMKVVAAALKAHPKVNASLDLENGELILKNYVHLGIAVDNAETGRGALFGHGNVESVGEASLDHVAGHDAPSSRAAVR